jgi:hypothetical protein
VTSIWKSAACLCCTIFVAGCNLFDSPSTQRSACEQAGIDFNDDYSKKTTLGNWGGPNLTEASDSVVLQKFLDTNGIFDSLRYVVSVIEGMSTTSPSGASIKIIEMDLTLDSTQGHDTLVFVNGMESIALRYLSISGGKFKYMSGGTYLPRNLITLSLAGKWEQIWTEAFSLPMLLSYSMNNSRVSDAGTALVQAQKSPCLDGLNLSNNKLTEVPIGLTTWNSSERALALSGNSICMVTHEDSAWITAAESANSLTHFWPQSCSSQ